MEKNNILGNRIKSRRQKLSLSQSDLSKQLNCTQAALSQYENGNREPGLQDLINIANALDTTTDYLLGMTEIASKDANIKTIGDYLGLTEASINKLRTYYWERKETTLENYLQEDVRSYSGATPGDDNYDNDYLVLQKYHTLILESYTRLLNEFICSSAFHIFVSCLTNNLHIERMTYDLMKIVARQYDSLSMPIFGSSHAENAYGLVDDTEDNIKQYSLNLFDAQTVFADFCKDFTKLDEIKKLEYSESFYQKLHYIVYHYTRPMFEKKEYSIEVLEKGIATDALGIMDRVFELLSLSKKKEA